MNKQNKLNICFFGYMLGGSSGGSIRYTKLLSEELIKQGHNVTIATIKAEDDSIIKGVTYINLLETQSSFSWYSKVRFIIRSLFFFAGNKNFDIIHAIAGYYSFSLVVNLIRWCTSIPIVYSVLSPVKRVYPFNRFKEIICVSRNIKDFFGNKGIYIPPPLDTQEFKTHLATHQKQESEKAEKRILIGTIGSPIYRKGFVYLVQAIPYVLKKYPEAFFLFAINLPDIKKMPENMKEMKKIEAAIEAESLRDHIEIRGKVEVPQFMNQLDIFVYAVQTTIGMVDIPYAVIEAMAGGSVVITSPKGGISEIIHDKHNGILVEDGQCSNPKAYAEKIIECLANKDLKKKIRERAVMEAGKFDIGLIYPQILEVYRNVSK